MTDTQKRDIIALYNAAAASLADALERIDDADGNALDIVER